MLLRASSQRLSPEHQSSAKELADLLMRAAEDVDNDCLAFSIRMARWSASHAEEEKVIGIGDHLCFFLPEKTPNKTVFELREYLQSLLASKARAKDVESQLAERDRCIEMMTGALAHFTLSEDSIEMFVGSLTDIQCYVLAKEGEILRSSGLSTDGVAALLNHLRQRDNVSLRISEGELFGIRAEPYSIVFQSLSPLDDIKRALIKLYMLQMGEQHQRRQRHIAETARVEIEHAARHDALTGIPNRRYFDSVLEGRQAEAMPTTIIRIDLDHFKSVNDTLGHEAGDQVLCHIGALLRAEVRKNDFFARVGGDEFVIILTPGSSLEDAVGIAERLLQRLETPFLYGNKPCRFGASFGIASNDIVDCLPSELLCLADAALYRAKKRGKNRSEVVTKELYHYVHRSHCLLGQLEPALSKGQIVPYFQPQFCAFSHRLLGAEALVRWVHPEFGILGPEQFLELACQLGLSAEVDQVIFDQTQQLIRGWEHQGLSLPRISFNISRSRLLQLDFKEVRVFKKTVAAEISFELLESIFLDGGDVSVEERIRELRGVGVDIEVDDFGSGYTSIIGLTKILPKRLKVDQRLVKPIVSDPKSKELAQSIIKIGKTLDIQLVAEGVETMQHAMILSAIGYQVLQGYAFSPPMSASAMVTFLSKNDARRELV